MTVLPGDPDVLSQVESAYHQHFEVAPVRASVSFVGVESIEILRYRQENSVGRSLTTYISLGMSRHPMVAGADLVVGQDGPRAELMLSLSDQGDEVWRRLAILAAAPAVESVVYEPNARLDLGEPWLHGSRCTGVVVAAGPLVTIATAVGPVDVFRVLPATQTEMAWARVHGSEELLRRWRAAETDLTDLLRSPVVLE